MVLYLRRTSTAPILIASALVAAVVMAWPMRAQADHHCSGNSDIGQDSGSATGQCGGSTPGGGGSSSSRPGDPALIWNRWCSEVALYREGAVVEMRIVGPASPEQIAEAGLDPAAAEWVVRRVRCLLYGEGMGDIYSVVGDIYSVVEAGAVASIDPLVLRDSAAARLRPPDPTPASAPPDLSTFAQLFTFLWLEEYPWEPLSASESQGAVSVSVTAVPIRVSWDMGDGITVACPGPGVVWAWGMAESATDCGHTYRHSTYGEPDGRFHGSVTVEWQFSWSFNGVPQGVFGTLPMSSPFEMAVAEIQAIEQPLYP